MSKIEMGCLAMIISDFPNNIGQIVRVVGHGDPDFVVSHLWKPTWEIDTDLEWLSPDGVLETFPYAPEKSLMRIDDDAHLLEVEDVREEAIHDKK